MENLIKQRAVLYLGIVYGLLFTGWLVVWLPEPLRIIQTV
jgi:hypothetical protein